MNSINISKDRLYSILYECLDWIFTDNTDIAFTVEGLDISNDELRELGFAWVADIVGYDGEDEEET